MEPISYSKNLVSVIENYTKLLELLASEDDSDKRQDLAKDLASTLNACFIATTLIASIPLKEDRAIAIKHFNEAKDHIKLMSDAGFTPILDGGDKLN
jgi:predicted S18 family serine protease